MSGLLIKVLTALVSTIAGAIAGAFIKGAKLKRKENKAIKGGLQSILRGEIIKQHEKYMEREYCPVYAKDALSKQYESYHELGGNGVITELYHEIIELPEHKGQ